MWNRRVAVSCIAFAGLVFAGACTEAPPTGPLAFDENASLFQGPQDPSRFSGGLDAVFLRIAQQNPGFGGIFYGEDGALTVVMAGARPLSARLGSSLAAMGVNLEAQPVRFVEGQYDFVQLEAMLRRVRPVHGLAGVVFTDADEAANRVRIGVEDAAAAGAVERAIGMLGVPREAIIVSEAQRIIPMQATLRDRWRPVAGGLQINFPGFVCTLGFNVRSPAAPDVHGFVTNSHCTTLQGTMMSTPYWQPSGSPDVTSPNFIGTEEHDAPYFTSAQEPRCPVGRICTWADAAGVRYAPGVPNAFGAIFRTSGGPALGTLTVDPANPVFAITAERQYPILGDVLHKVGRTTGWTSGTVTSTCVNTNLAPNETYLCDNYVTGTERIVQSGDSGAPVFRRLGTGADPHVELNGILWGASGNGLLWAYSAMGNIRFENQGPAPWITYPGQTPPPPGGPPPGP